MNEENIKEIRKVTPFMLSQKAEWYKKNFTKENLSMTTAYYDYIIESLISGYYAEKEIFIKAYKEMKEKGLLNLQKQ